MNADQGYLDLNILEFLDVISGTSQTKTYTVSWGQGNMTGTLSDLCIRLRDYPRDYDIWRIAPQLEEIMSHPIHRYNNLALADIVNFIEHYSSGWDLNRLKALYIDVARYYYNTPQIKSILSGSSSTYTIYMENLRYLKNYLASKLDLPQNDTCDDVLPPQLVLTLKPDKCMKIFNWLNSEGFIDENTDEASFRWIFGGNNCPVPFHFVKWIKAKQLVREVLWMVIALSKEDYKAIRDAVHTTTRTIPKTTFDKTPSVFLNKDGNPLVLSRPKKVLSRDSDKINVFFATLLSD